MFPSIPPPTRNTKAQKPTKKKLRKASRNATHLAEAISASPVPFLFPFPRPLHEPRHGGASRRDEAGGGRGGAPVAAALRALRARADYHPVAGGRRGGEAAGAAAAGDAGGGGVHAAGRLHGADALRLGHLHAGLLPHALGPRPWLRIPLRRLRHQPLRDREGHLPLARGRLLAQGGLPMAYIFQASIHADVKNTK